MADEKKQVVVPVVNVKHNEDDSGLIINVELPGASKESVDLDMGDNGFCVSADAEDFRYENCYMLAHDIKPDEAKAKYNSGLLAVSVPFRETKRGHKVRIE